MRVTKPLMHSLDKMGSARPQQKKKKECKYLGTWINLARQQSGKQRNNIKEGKQVRERDREHGNQRDFGAHRVKASVYANGSIVLT